MKQDPDVRRYRVEMEVPRVTREGTTWRTLAVEDNYSEVMDLGDNLMGSLGLAGIDREVARSWVTRLRVISEGTITTRSVPETMPTRP